MILTEPSQDPRQRLGRAGERAAEEVLSAAGMRVLERRYRARRGEIDLIAEQGERLIFVEVKARAGRGYGAPAEAVTAAKRRSMARVALLYLQRRGWLERPCRFDVIEVVADGGSLTVRHIVDAFRLWPTG